MSSHVGPVIFADRRARRQLVEEGEVVTVRAGERTTGDTWWRESRTGPKQGDCHIEFVDWVDTLELDHLEVFVEKSGMPDAKEWQDAIFDLHGQLGVLALYRVTEREVDSQ